MVTKTSAEAQNRFGELLDLVQREPVAITRHGRPAAYIVSPRDMEPIMRERERRNKAVEEYRALSERIRQYQAQNQAQAQGLPEIGEEEIDRIVHEVRAERSAR